MLLPTINFRLAEARTKGVSKLGVGPAWAGRLPAALPTYFSISGVTRDANGLVITGITVNLFRTVDEKFIDSTVSDASGNYSFRTAGPAEAYFAVAYLAGNPDIAGTTVNTLVGS